MRAFSSTVTKTALAVIAGLALAGGVVLTVRRTAVPPPRPPARATRPAEGSPAMARQRAESGMRAETARCEAERAALLGEPALPGAPRFEASRAQIVARAKGEPTYFVQEPAFESTRDPEVIAHRIRLTTTAHAWDALASFLTMVRGRSQLARAVLLREGYLYSEDPNLAFAIASQVRLEHLFLDKNVWIQRGESTLHAERSAKGYVFADGPSRGEPARLLLFDRVGAGQSGEAGGRAGTGQSGEAGGRAGTGQSGEAGGPAPPELALHRDLRALRYRMYFDAIRVERVSARRMLASLRYGSLWVSVVLESDGPRLSPVCRIVEPSQSAALEQQIARNRERQRVLSLLRASIVTQIDERLPFDEPRTEVGQEDGFLRRGWRHAYLTGAGSFRYNGDRYRVFDGQGRPRVPQVCIDFLTDTFERASGTWWRGQGEAPGRIDGKLDFEKIEDLPRGRVEAFIDFAQRMPAWFDVYTTEPGERIEFGYKRQFFDYLAEHTERYQAGDIVVIRGKVPWDEEHMHYHSFFVYETDPVSGIPVAIAGNAGTPAVWTWEAEARRTPHRSVWYRIRPRLEWLSSVVGDAAEPDKPPVLARGGS